MKVDKPCNFAVEGEKIKYCRPAKQIDQIDPGESRPMRSSQLDKHAQILDDLSGVERGLSAKRVAPDLIPYFPIKLNFYGYHPFSNTPSFGKTLYIGY